MMRRSIAVGACLVLCMSICYARVNPKEFPDALPVHEAAHMGDKAKLKEVCDQTCVSHHIPPHATMPLEHRAVARLKALSTAIYICVLLTTDIHVCSCCLAGFLCR